MLKRPPAHRVDATPVLILHADDAWDHERIEKEEADVEAENERRTKAARESKKPPELLDISEHPYHRYQRGDTRMDLEAASTWRGQHLSAADYLREDGEPVRFVLRRLRWDEYHRVRALMARGSEAALRACQYGLVDIEGGGELSIDPDAAERSDAEMQMLHDFDPDLAVMIGMAVMAASARLRPDEKKA